MKNTSIFLLAFFLFPAFLLAKKKDSKIIVVAYYFPNYHTDDARNIQNKGADWSEWELVKAAQLLERMDRRKLPGTRIPKINLATWKLLKMCLKNKK